MSNQSYSKLENTTFQILRQLYEDKYNTDEYNYVTVNDFYAYLGYDLELYHELQTLGIVCTSDLQEKLLHRKYKN